MNRRTFLSTTGRAAGALALYGAIPGTRGADAPSRQLRVGVIGLGRGFDHVKALVQIPGVQVAWLCDIDDHRAAAAAKWLEGKQERAAKTTRNLQHLLDDSALDGVTIATPNFWHAPATILACKAGKHVYVEKPGSHNAQEAEWMVAAARRHQRKVQMGTQRRSWPGVIEAMQRLREGVIGKVLSASTYYDALRPSIGRGKAVPVPANIDYALWQGPVPERPYVDNLVHYNWHWRWHWGGGELANNGVHALDVARWGLGVDHPSRLTYVGGRYFYDDDQETPDTAVATYDFGKCGISFDQSSCNPRVEAKNTWVTFYGERGSLAQIGSGYKIYDLKGAEIGSGDGPGGDMIHFKNWVDAIRDNVPLNQEIENGQRSTLLCHLGNIAYRVRRELHCDPATGKILKDAEARKFWSREYRSGWKARLT